MSYKHIGEQVTAMSAGLQGIGLKKGERVALLLPNCPLYIIAYYAVLKAGGVVVNCNPLYAENFIANEINDAEAKFLITININVLYSKAYAVLQKTTLEKLLVGTMQSMLPFPKNILFPIVKKHEVATLHVSEKIIKLNSILTSSRHFRPVEINDSDDIAVLQFTGGTTGIPKAAMLTHRNLFANAYQCACWLGRDRRGKDIMMGVLPFFHAFANTAVMNLSILNAVTIVAHPRFDLRMLVKDIVKKRPTLMPGVPSMFVALNHVRDVRKYDFTSLELCISGGAPLPLEVKQAFEALTGCVLVEGYGLTEASPLVSCNPLYSEGKSGTIGMPFVQTEVLIEDMENRGTFLPVGGVGELCVRGPQVMKGYWRHDDETKLVLWDNILRTGDIAMIDHDGYITIKDRLKEMIISGGYNIYPRAIEEIMYQHPSIKEAAVIGIDDEYRGQAVKLFVALKEGQTLTEEGIKDYLKDKVAKFEMPKDIVFRESLPKTLIGKIAKKELK